MSLCGEAIKLEGMDVEGGGKWAQEALIYNDFRIRAERHSPYVVPS